MARVRARGGDALSDQVDWARELDERDREVAAAIAQVASLQERSAGLGARAAAAGEFLSRLPTERTARERAAGAAEAELRALREAAAQAEQALARVEAGGGAEAVAEARRAVVRTLDAASVAERLAQRAAWELEALEREAEATEREVGELEGDARACAEELGRLPRLSRAAAEVPGPGLDGVVEWAARAQAALLVARSGLDTERERIVREANELGTAVLGEPVATSVSRVRERIEQALTA